MDSYALTATGDGAGYVTMVFGNGGNPNQQPQADPVQVQVFEVVPQLYSGDLKVVLSSNPLDEQVSLRHSADFAGNPADYEFEWRWATGAASAPATYAIGEIGLIDRGAAPGRQMRSRPAPNGSRCRPVATDLGEVHRPDRWPVRTLSNWRCTPARITQSVRQRGYARH